MEEARHVARAVANLGDKIALSGRLEEIERALQFDEDPERRRYLRREYLDLTDPKRNAA
jgi:hypothetical protein